jgi:hypothetical protein
MSRPIPYTSIMIDPMNDPQVQHWARDMQVQKCDLRAAVRLVGPRLSDLRRFFGKSARIIFLENSGDPSYHRQLSEDCRSEYRALVRQLKRLDREPRA